jgi:hypothetical protein
MILAAFRRSRGHTLGVVPPEHDRLAAALTEWEKVKNLPDDADEKLYSDFGNGVRKTEDGYMIEAPKEAAGVLLPHLDKWEAEGQAVAHDGDVCYLLWPGLRGEAVEPATGELIRRELPVSSEMNNSLTRIPWARSSGRRSSGRVTVTGWLRSMLAAPI